MGAAEFNIAVVDDDVRLLESLANLFESAGYRVCAFASAQALADRGFEGVDCLLTDIHMPGMDGFALHGLAKRERPELPVFLMTGREDLAGQARATDIRGFLRKPFDGPALLAAVGDALQSKVVGDP